MQIKIFKYIEDFDFFVVEPEYKQIADELGLTEWTPVTWIGRYFSFDNDYGEHWFDNWELREKAQDKIEKLGVDETEVFIIDPDRFSDRKDGPCHTSGQRKLFWTDVLKSLHLSLDIIISEALHANEKNKEFDKEEYKPDLERRIQHIKTRYQIK